MGVNVGGRWDRWGGGVGLDEVDFEPETADPGAGEGLFEGCWTGERGEAEDFLEEGCGLEGGGDGEGYVV